MIRAPNTMMQATQSKKREKTQVAKKADKKKAAATMFAKEAVP